MQVPILYLTMSAIPRLRPLALGALLVLVACEPAPRPEFRVGLIGVFEGSAANSSGIPAQRGAMLAADEINAAGGVSIDGVPHTLVLLDRRSDPRPDAAASVARALINLDSVDVIIGPQGSSMALAAGAVAEASQVPLVTPMSSSPAVTAGRRMVTRLAFLDAYQGEVLARYAFDSLGLRRAAALYNAASPYGREVSALFGSTFESIGGQMVRVETFNADDKSTVRDRIQRLVSANPDALLLPNFTTGDSAIFRLARGLGFEGRFLGTDSWDGISLMRREDVQGVTLVANWDRRGDRPALRTFLTHWDERFASERPRATAAATYDAVYLVARAAERSGRRSGFALVDSLRSTGEYDGAFGRYSFRGDGDPVRGAVLLEVSLDSTVLRAAIEPAR